MRLTFVRHGQSSANAEAWFAGHNDAPLTELGRKQAAKLHERLLERHLDLVLCSDLQRARETAEIIVAGRPLELRISAALRERSCGRWERRTIAELEAAGDMALLHHFDGRPPEGESLRDVARRVLTALPELVHPTGNTLIVGHGAMMRATIGLLDGVRFANIGTWKPENGEIATRELGLPELRAALAKL